MSSDQLVDLILAAVKSASWFGRTSADVWAVPHAAPHLRLCLGTEEFRDWLAEFFIDREKQSADAVRLAERYIRHMINCGNLAFSPGFRCPRWAQLEVAPGERLVIGAMNRNNVIAIGPGGWETTRAPAEVFLRWDGVDLPAPIADPEGAAARKLWAQFDLGETSARLLNYVLFSWLWAAPPFPILCIVGAPGAGKSTLAWALKEIVDPAGELVSWRLADPRDIAPACASSYVVVFDNVTNVDGEVSDAICAVSAGASLRARRLFTNEEVASAGEPRPIVITAVADPAVRGDLASRSVVIELPPRGRFGDAREVMSLVRELRPRILGWICDRVRDALAGEHAVSEEAFETRLSASVAAAEAGGLEGVARLLLWRQRAVLEERAEEDVLFNMVLSYVNRNGGSWRGTTTELFRRLVDTFGREFERHDLTPRGLGRMMMMRGREWEAGGLLCSRRRIDGKSIWMLSSLSVRAGETSSGAMC